MGTHRLAPGRALLAAVVVLSARGAMGDETLRLRYISRFEHNPTYLADHLIGIQIVRGHYGLVSSDRGVRLFGLDTLPVGGTTDTISTLDGLRAYNSVSPDDRYVYVNERLRGWGTAIIHVDPTSLTLSLVGRMSEPGVYYEKMFLDGERLYVTAHSSGIRVFDIVNRTDPLLIGSLSEGFDDALAIAVEGDTAYVADGAGGLKIVDVTNVTAPVIIAGEDPQSSAGTSHDVMVINGDVYVAAGGAGVAWYRNGQLQQRVLFDTAISALQLAHVGDYLAVADTGGIAVFTIEPDGSLTPRAGEYAPRRSTGGTTHEDVSVRNWQGVTFWGDDRIVAANWDTVDVYQLVDPATDDQPDITPSAQRLRFAPDGGSSTVRLVNQGSATLHIDAVWATRPTFSVTPTSAVLEPDEYVDITIEYAGGQPGSGLVLIESNDPDENPLPIQVFGDTNTLDPGEPAAPFVLESWTYDHDADEFIHGTFDLDAHVGKVVYLQVFGTW